jgi:hypothetical protein
MLAGYVEHAIGKVDSSAMPCAALGERDAVVAWAAAYVQDSFPFDGLASFDCVHKSKFHALPKYVVHDSIDNSSVIAVDGVEIACVLMEESLRASVCH